MNVVILAWREVPVYAEALVSKAVLKGRGVKSLE
jgi:hypothetical protein